jgi:high affinity Mn2+ porin
MILYGYWHGKPSCALRKLTTSDLSSVRLLILLVALLPSRLTPQQADPRPPSEPSPFENWNLYYQATSIGDYHGTFNAPYTGPLSLQDYPERDVSITTTLFFDWRVEKNTQIIFNPEIAGGKGFSGVDGIANPPNGELPRVASAEPKPYIARLLLIGHDFGFGSETEHVESDINQLAGERPQARYSVYAGRFSVIDYFDNNAYTHDPREQFMVWAVMYNGAWDYPADTRGYTWGIVQEFNTRKWAFRYGIAAMPKVANGEQFDRRLFRDHGQMLEAERRWQIVKRDGAVRVLYYANRAQMGNYAEALKIAEETHTTPSVIATRSVGTLKYGTGVSFDQAITPDFGFFIRLGWNDGKTESFVFTAMDRLASGGVSLKGTRWHRRNDVLATSLTAGGLSGVHASYLAHGGLDFLIGDGQLNYAPELRLGKLLQRAPFPRGFTAAVDFQHDANLAYNHDRGPVWIYSLRLHVEFGIKPFQAK